MYNNIFVKNIVIKIVHAVTNIIYDLSIIQLLSYYNTSIMISYCYDFSKIIH